MQTQQPNPMKEEKEKKKNTRKKCYNTKTKRPAIVMM